MLVANIEQPSLVMGVLGCQTGRWELEGRAAMWSGVGSLECRLSLAYAYPSHSSGFWTQ